MLVIGDVHGCLTSLDALLNLTAPQRGDRPWLFLGDLVDRGPCSRQVVQRVIDLGDDARTILGNHEQMMLDARMDWSKFRDWNRFGGKETLASYEEADPSSEANASNERNARNEITDAPVAVGLDAVPAAHWAFLENLPAYIEDDHFIFVHASVRPELPMDLQDEAALRWNRLDPKGWPHLSGKTVICGHTPQQNGFPLDLGHTICLDTHAYENGWLTALDLLTFTFYQANEKGQTRSGQLRQ